MNKTQQIKDALPLEVILQQCHDDQHMSPTTNEQAWLDCLQDVYMSEMYTPALAELAAAIYKVWKAEITRSAFSDALNYFKNASGTKAFDSYAVIFQSEKFFVTDCLILNGNSVVKSFVTCGNNVSLRFDGTSPYSLLIWLKMTGPNGDSLMGRLVGSAWNGGPTRGGYIFMAMNDGLRSYRLAKPYHCDGNCRINQGQKYFLATTFNGLTSNIYQDSVLRGSKNYDKTFINAPADAQFIIGSAYRGSTGIYDASIQANIARAAVFNKALDQDAITKLATTILTGKEDNLVAYWDFTRKSAEDLSGNGNHGTLVGTAKFGSGY